MSFQSFNLSAQLMASLERLHFKKPTPVQEQTIPIILDGHDVLVSSQTGTGKTATFSVPIISKLIENTNYSALIVTPTRELASQVMKSFKDFLSQEMSLKTALLIGGEPISKQLSQLKGHINIIVGTPGRINDHLKRKSLNLAKVKFLVLDETDRMLDMGFSVQIDDIVKHIPDERQTLLFSATLPHNIIKMSEKYMSNPQRVAIGSVNSPVEKINQEIVKLREDEKYKELLSQINKRDGSIIVFVKTKYSTENIAKKLRFDKHEANAIHGDLRHSKRESIINSFRKEKFRILVATDVAARGLDIPHIQHVINYDLPQCPEDYIHRIGRTARAGQNGDALSFVTNSENEKWNAITNLMNPNSKKSTSNSSFKPAKKVGFKNKIRKKFFRAK
ncbi:DEAD/DEAH box helicase [Rickettsiales bacterium LUAb2]